MFTSKLNGKIKIEMSWKYQNLNIKGIFKIEMYMENLMWKRNL